MYIYQLNQNLHKIWIKNVLGAEMNKRANELLAKKFKEQMEEKQKSVHEEL